MKEGSGKVKSESHEMVGGPCSAWQQGGILSIEH